MNKFDIIRGALDKLTVPIDESNFYTDIIYQKADKEFDNIMYTAFTSMNFGVNTVIADLNISVDDKVTYNNIEYTPYMLPQDFLFLLDKPTENIFFGRNRIYRAGEGIFTIRYCKTNDVTKITPTVRKYLEYYLASELAPVLNRHQAQNDLFQRALYYQELLKTSDVYNNVDIYGGLKIDLY